MLNQVILAMRMMVAMTVLTGIVYPLMMTAVSQLAFRDSANGSLIRQNERVIGSVLIAQKFTSDRYFYSRPSSGDFNALSSGGSNFGLTSKKLEQQAKDVRAKYSGEDVPPDMIYASASGLDPHISPAAALFQVERVAKARGLSEIGLKLLVENKIEKRQLGFLGEERVNVVLLNLSLDRLNDGR